MAAYSAKKVQCPRCKRRFSNVGKHLPWCLLQRDDILEAAQKGLQQNKVRKEVWKRVTLREVCLSIFLSPLPAAVITSTPCSERVLT